MVVIKCQLILFPISSTKAVSINSGLIHSPGKLLVKKISTAPLWLEGKQLDTNYRSRQGKHPWEAAYCIVDVVHYAASGQEQTEN